MRTLLLLITLCATPLAAANESNESELKREHAQALIGAFFQVLDCDLEGNVELSEIDDHFAQVWGPIDLDRSRALSSREYWKMHRPLTPEGDAALWRDADRDGDSLVSPAELRSQLRRLMPLLDADGDLEISGAEAGFVAHRHEHHHKVGH